MFKGKELKKEMENNKSAKNKKEIVEELDKKIEEKENEIMRLRKEIEKLYEKKSIDKLAKKYPVGGEVQFLGKEYIVDGYEVGKNGDNVLKLKLYKQTGEISIKITKVIGENIKAVYLIK